MGVSSTKSSRLISLAQADFQSKLTTAEVLFLTQSVGSEITYFGPKVDDNKSPLSNARSSKTWSFDREIRATLIRWLCTNKEAGALLDVKGIQIHGARIAGALDLSYTDIRFRLLFRRCGFDDEFRMHAAQAVELYLTGCSLISLDLERAHIQGTLSLSDGFYVTHGVNLSNSRIDGDFDCTGGFFQGAPDDDGGISEAINATDAVIGANVYFGDNSETRGAVRFANARVGADLDCSNNGKSTFRSSQSVCNKGSNVAFDAQSADVRLDVSFGNDFTAYGPVDLESLVCGGDLTFTDGAVLHGTAEDKEESTGYALRAGNLQVTGRVTMDEHFRATGAVGFDGSRIKSDLDLSDAYFFNPAGTSLSASGTALFVNNVDVGGDFNLSNSRITGAITASNTHVGGELNCADALFDIRTKAGASGLTLTMLRSTVVGSLSLSGKFEAFGGIQLGGTHVGGNFSMEGATLHCNGKVEDGTAYALQAQALTCTGHIFLRHGFQAFGLVSLMDASCGGSLDCSSGLFCNPFRRDVSGTGVALGAQRISIGSILLLREKFEARGEVDFSDAKIGPRFECTHGTFSRSVDELDPERLFALNCVRMQSTGDVLLNDGFVAHGQVMFENTTIAGDFHAENAQFLNPKISSLSNSGIAFRAFSMKVGRGLYLRDKFRAEGTVSINNAKVEQSADFRGGTFSNLFSSDSVALSLTGTTIVGDLYMGPHQLQDGTFYFRTDGVLDLQNAVIYGLDDDSSAWPKPKKLLLDGFTYKTFARNPQDVNERLHWLALQPPEVLHDQPYLQLAKVLEESGDATGAQTVRVTLEELKTRVPSKHPLEGAVERVLLGKTVGYYYKPINAIYFSAGLSALGWIIYRRSYIAGNILPTEKNAFESSTSGQGLPQNYPKFSPFVYSLENSLPFVKFGQADKWHPAREATAPRLSGDVIAEPSDAVLRIRQALRWCGLLYPPRPNQPLTSPRSVRVFLWIHILLGWILATLFIAGFSGLVHSSK